MIQAETTTPHVAASARRSGQFGGTLPKTGNWQIVARAARGAWAEIYRASPAGSPGDRPAGYAVKMLRADRRHEAEGLRMFAREAQVGQQVSHPHLIPVLDVQLGRAPQFLVMPWLEGASLESYVRCGQGLDPAAVLWIARQTAEAMDALDRAGWMHGDIKPGNIFLSPTGHATLIDLGFARRYDELANEPAAILGTGYYLAPEYVSNSYLPDVRSDIYSLGVVLYQLLAGRLPFEGRTFEELAAQHKQAAPPRLRTLAPHIMPRAAELVHRMLAKDPLRRPQTPGELVTELVRLEIEAFSERAA